MCHLAAYRFSHVAIYEIVYSWKWREKSTFLGFCDCTGTFEAGKGSLISCVQQMLMGFFLCWRRHWDSVLSTFPGDVGTIDYACASPLAVLRPREAHCVPGSTLPGVGVLNYIHTVNFSFQIPWLQFPLQA